MIPVHQVGIILVISILFFPFSSNLSANFCSIALDIQLCACQCAHSDVTVISWIFLNVYFLVFHIRNEEIKKSTLQIRFGESLPFQLFSF